ncbi:hypothetical protein GR257_34355 [Rhizobium leguminosarum]|uniref:Uncharacterized protein n=1 Tax=Rhizobium leguminosarum TaxID=384 RepID=A0A7K3VUM5_RHILE|nr:hypothetical protein [Rhizobium leguminosarum]NEK34314.1 hypothetical protein [Rhizobium leguminosarum]
MTLHVDLSTYLAWLSSEKVSENRFLNLPALGVPFSNLGLGDKSLADFTPLVRARDKAGLRQPLLGMKGNPLAYEGGRWWQLLPNCAHSSHFYRSDYRP